MSTILNPFVDTEEKSSCHYERKKKVLIIDSSQESWVNQSPLLLLPILVPILISPQSLAHTSFTWKAEQSLNKRFPKPEEITKPSGLIPIDDLSTRISMQLTSRVMARGTYMYLFISFHMKRGWACRLF